MLKIRTAPDPFLKKKTKKITVFDKKLKDLVKEMKVFLRKSEDPPGVGLAANQLGIGKSLVLVTKGLRKRGDKGKVIPLINPKIIYFSQKKEKSWEGCLSVPGIYGNVLRSYKIKAKYKNLNGEEKEEVFEGFSAFIVQHEVDHLKGVLFTERIVKQKGEIYKSTGEKNEKKEEILEQVAI